MTVVQANRFYEWTIQNEEAECEGCGKQMQLPDPEELDAGIKEPFWHREHVHNYIGMNLDKFHAYCEKCIQTEVVCP